MKTQKQTNFPDDYNILNLSKIYLDGFFINVTKRYEQFYSENKYERFSSELFLNYIKEDSVVVDVGANYGYYSLLASKINKNGETISFEPVLENFEVLSKNIKENGFKHAKVFNLAVSNHTGVSKFNITEASDSSGFYDHPNTKTLEKRLIKTTSLDDFLGNKKIDVIKIDTEGHEIFVLNGMEKIIKNNKNLKLFIEFNPKCLLVAKTEPDSFIKRIDCLGFDIYIIKDSTRKLLKVNAENFHWRDYLEEMEYCNLLCIKKANSMFVSFISHSSEMAGSERSLLDLLDGLSKREVLCHVILPRCGMLEEELKKRAVSYEIVSFRWWNLLEGEKSQDVLNHINEQSIEVAEKVNKTNPDLIYTNTSVVNMGALVSKILGKPHVWHVREFGEKDHNIKFILSEADRYDYISNHSNFVVFNSRAVEENFIKYSKPQRYETVYNNVTFKNEGPSNNVKFYSSNFKKLLILGTICPSKGQLDAVMALRELVKIGTEVELIIAGGVSSEEYLNKINEYIKNQKLEKYIKILPFVKTPQFLIKECDIVLYCSTKEAFGRSIPEALLTGKIVIGTNSGGIPEIIKNNYSGLLYEPGNYIELAEKIKFIYENPKKAQTLVDNGFKFVADNFSDEKYSGEILRLLKKVIGESNKLIGFSLFDLLYKKVKKQIEQQKEKEILSKEEEIKILKNIIFTKENEIKELKNSTSWKVTKPMRSIKDKSLRLILLICKSVKIFKENGSFFLLKKILKFLLLKFKLLDFALKIKKGLSVLRRDGMIALVKKILILLKNKILICVDFLEWRSSLFLRKNNLLIFRKKDRLIMTLLVRDEIDIIKQNIEFHLAQGVDFIIATDNGSVDGTKEVLLEYQKSGRLELINEASQDYSQSEWVNRMGDLAFKKHRASYVFHCDADEFWFSRSGDLKNEIKNSREDVLMVNLANVLLEDKNGEESFPSNMRYAAVKPWETLNLEMDSIDKNLYLFRYPPKVIFRKNVRVIQGNHDVLGVCKANKRLSKDIIIYHYPIRSKKHFFQKIINGGSSYSTNKKLSKKIGWHWRRWYDAYNDGVLEREYQKLILKNEEVESLIKNKTIELVPFKIINKI